MSRRSLFASGYSLLVERRRGGIRGAGINSDGGVAFGYPGVYYGDVTRQGASGTAAFRYVHVADSPIPEPATSGLVASACFGLLGRRTRRRDAAAV